MYCLYRHFQQYFSYIMVTSFSGGRSRSTRKEPPTMGKQLVNFITCGCESSAPFRNSQRWARIHAVLVIGLYVNTITLALTVMIGERQLLIFLILVQLLISCVQMTNDGIGN